MAVLRLDAAALCDWGSLQQVQGVVSMKRCNRHRSGRTVLTDLRYTKAEQISAHTPCTVLRVFRKSSGTGTLRKNLKKFAGAIVSEIEWHIWASERALGGAFGSQRWEWIVGRSGHCRWLCQASYWMRCLRVSSACFCPHRWATFPAQAGMFQNADLFRRMVFPLRWE